MSKQPRPDGEPRRVDASLQSILDRAAARQKGNNPEPAQPAAALEPSATTSPKLRQAAPSGDTEQRNPARIHPDKRGPLVLANAIAEARGDKPIDPDTLSYYSPELIQATMPHSDPKTNVWVRKNGSFTLIVASGYDQEGEMVGVPYGAFPRLVLAYIVTQVIGKPREPGQRRIQLTSHFGEFLKAVGYTGNHRGNIPSAKRLKDQLNRLLRASITFEYKEGTAQAGRVAGLQMHVAPRFELWWDFHAPDQESLFGSWLDLSEDFYNAILARPVPLKTEVLKALHKDILALDVYMWVSYRLMGMKGGDREEIAVSYASLQAQFGTGIAEDNYRKFRERLKKAFAKVALFWHTPSNTSGESLLRYEFTESGIILYRSPLLVSRGNRTSHNEDAAALLTARRFDDETRKQARLRAGTLYSVDHLEKQYFAWIESKDLTPANPRAHFLSFIKRHVDRNR